MEEEVSWQKLMGIENTEGEDDSLSPVFHKNKWIVLPKSMKEKNVEPENNGITSIPGSSQHLNSIKDKGESNLGENSKVPQEEIVYHSPIKTRSMKRKFHDHPLSGSLSPRGPLKKKSRTRNRTNSKNLLEQNLNLSSLTNDSVAVKKSHSTLLTGSIQLCKSNPISHSKRKLIYSSNKLNTQNQTSNIDINDFYKSVIIMEEADKVSSSKVSNTIPLLTVPKEFVTFSTLLNDKDNFNSKSPENPIVSNYQVQEKSSFGLKNYNPIKTNLFNDTLNNYQFTEVEESLGYCKPNGNNQDKSIDPLSQSVNIDSKVEKINRSENDYQADQTKKLSITETQSADQSSPNTHLKENAFNDSFNNFHFTEVEEQYHSLKPKIHIFDVARELTLNADKVKENLIINTSTKTEYSESDPNVLINALEINHNDIMPAEECFSKPQEKICCAQSPIETEKPNEILTPTDMFLSDLPSTLKLKSLNNCHSQDPKSRLELTYEDSLLHNTNVTISKNGILLERVKSDSPKWQNQQHFQTIENDFNTMKIFTSKSLNDIDFMQLENDIKNHSESESNDLTENTDGSKSKVEALLQGILDKPSDVPIQRLLSEEFLDANTTVVQFSTASGSIVKASQESLDKGRELLQEVMAEVENNGSPSYVNLNAAYEGKLDQFCENDVLNNEKNESELALQSIMIEESKGTKKIFEDSLHGNLEENNAPLANNILNHENILNKEESMKFESTSRIFSGSLGPLKIVPKLELDSLINIHSTSNTSHTMPAAFLNQEREVLPEAMEIVSKHEKHSDSCRNIIKDIFTEESPLANEEKPKVFSNSGSEFHFCTAGGNTVPVSKESLQFVKESQNKSDNEEIKDNFSPLKLTYINILNKTSSNSPASSGKFSQEESSMNSDSQESLFLHNNSSFEDFNFSTENFVCKELKKDNNELCSNENKTPLKTPFKSFKLSSSKRLLSLSTRSKRLSLLDSENTTPKLLSRKTKTSGEQSTFQQELKKAKYEAEADRIMKSPEYELNNQIITSAHKRNQESSSDKSQSKLKPKPFKTKDLLFKTANGVKVNITKQSLRSARKQLKCELEPVIYEKEVDFIIKSPEYDLQNIKPSSLTTAKGKHITISEHSLQKVKLLFKDDFESVRQSSDVQLLEDEFVLTTATGQGVNVSKESMEKVKNIFQDEIGPSTKDLSSISKPLNSSEINDFEINNQNFRKNKLSEKVSSVVDVSCTPKKGIEKSLSKENLTTSEHTNSEYPETKVRIHLNSSEAESHINISASTTKIDISSEKSKSSDIIITNKTENLFNGSSHENVIKNQIIFVKSPTLEEYCKEILSNLNHIESSCDKNQVIMKDSHGLIKLEKDLEPNEPFDTFSLEQPFEEETKDIVNRDVTMLSGKSKITFTANLHEQEIASITKTDPKHQPAPMCLDGISDKSESKVRNIMGYDLDVIPGCSKNSMPVLKLKETMGSEINDPETSDTYLSRPGIDLKFSGCNSKNSSFPMFSTAKGKIVMISEKTLQKVRSIFKDDFDEITSCSNNNLSSIELNENIKSKDAESTKKHPEYAEKGILPSIKENNINISEEVSQKVINNLKDEHDSSFSSSTLPLLKVKDNLEPENSKESGQSQSVVASSLGHLEFVTGTKLQEVTNLATAKCSKIGICDKASQKIKMHKDDFNVALMGITSCIKDKENFESKVCVNKQKSDKYVSGVETIMGESNYDSRTKLLNMFSIPKDSNVMPEEAQNVSKVDLEDPPCCSKALSFKFIEPEPCSSVRHEKNSTLTDCKETSQSYNTTIKIGNVMFSTAGGSKVSISEKSLNKAMHMFMDDIETVGHLSLEEKNQMGIKVDGQSSKLKIEREDKKKSCDEKSANSINDVKKKNNAHVMFSTAGESAVSISEDNMNQVKGIFKGDIGNLGDFKLKEEAATNITDGQSSKLMTEREDNIKLCDDKSGKSIPHVTKKNNAPVMFSTAGGSTVSVSEDSLNKVKGMFRDDIGTLGDFSLEEEAAMSITVDGQSSKLMVEREDKNKSCDEKSADVINDVRQKNNAPVMFSTAGGRTVSISEDSLNKVKDMFKDDIGTLGDFSLEEEAAMSITVDGQSSKLMIEREYNIKPCDGKSVKTIPHVTKKNNAPVMFSTAGGNAVSISEDSLNKVKGMFRDDIGTLGDFSLEEGAAMSITVDGQSSKLMVEREDKNKSCDEKSADVINYVRQKNNAPVMFSTAGGRTVSISEDSLNKVKGMFKDDIGTLGDFSLEEIPTMSITVDKSSKLMPEKEEYIKSCDDKSGKTIPYITKKDNTPVMFSTAGGSAGSISEGSLKEVKDMFIDDIGTLGDFSLEEEAAMSITVDGQSSKLMVEREDKNKSCDEKSADVINYVRQKNNAPVMFSTAGGRTVSISEDSLNKVKDMLKDDIGTLGDFSLEEEAAMSITVDGQSSKLMIEREYNIKPCDGKSVKTIPHVTKKNNAPVMFSTAGGNAVSISEDSLNKVKGMFKDDIGTLGDFSLEEEAAMSITVDGQSSKLMVEREDKNKSCDEKSADVINDVRQKNNAPVMFSTAGGSTVSISEDSLNKVEDMFKDDIGTLGDFSLEEEAAMSITVDGQSSKLMIEREYNIKPCDGKSVKTIPHVTEKNKAPVMFSTAGGNAVSISEDSLNKVKGMFRDDIGTLGDFSLEEEAAKSNTVDGQSSKLIVEREDKNKSCDDKSADIINYVRQKNNAPVMFSTAGGSTVSISEDSLNKVKGMFKDDIGTLGDFSFEVEPTMSITVDDQSSKLLVKRDDKIKSCDAKSGKTKPHAVKKINSPAMFSTAGGNKVSISDDSLNRVKDMFKDDIGDFSLKEAAKFMIAESEKITICNEKCDSTISHVTKLNNASVMFGEEASKSNTVNDHSSKLMIEDVFEMKRCNEISANTSHKINKRKAPMMFSTASGSKVSISEKSLNKVKGLFKEDIGTLDNFSLEEDATESTSVDGHFSKPMNKEDKIDVCNEKSDNSVSHILHKNIMPVMFSTAGGGKVNISEESLIKVKYMFKEDIDGLGNGPLEKEADRCIMLNNYSSEITLGEDHKINVANNIFPDLYNMEGKSISVVGRTNVGILEQCLQKVESVNNDNLENHINLGSEAVNNVSFISENIQTALGSHRDQEKSMLNKIFLNNNKNSNAPEIKNKISKVFYTADQNVSEQDLNSVRIMFKGGSEPSDDLETGMETKGAIVSDISFISEGTTQSALNNKCKINEKIKFNEIQDTSEVTEVMNKISAAFCTAGGSDVKVSNESLSKVKNIFKDDLGAYSKIEKSSTFVDDSPSVLPNLDLNNESAILLTSKEHSVNTSKGSLSQLKIKWNDELGGYTLEKNTYFESTKCLNPVTSKDSEALVNKSYVPEESLGIVKSQCQNDNDIECFPNHDSLIFPETPKTNTPLNSQNKKTNASQEQLGFTPTLAGQLLADKLNEIESFICQEKDKEHDSFEKVSFLQDSVSRDTPVSYKNKSKLRPMNSTNVSQRRLLYKSQEDNEDVGKPYITSPSLCSDRSQVKPIKSCGLEFDSDDDIFAGAQSQIDKENHDTNNSLELKNIGPIEEKRIFDCSSAIEPANKKIRLSEEFHTINMNEILAKREQKRKEERQKINLKIKNPPPVSQGLYKTIREKETLIKFMEDPLNNPNLYSYEKLLEMGLYADVINVTSKNAVEFQFDGHYFFKEECFSKSGYIDLGNGFILILSDSNKVGLNEISNAFLASPSVDPSLVPEGWIKNHYRWIVWKLASLEKSFPEILSRRYLTPLNVLHQLKFRYDREIDLVQRPALRRILECDEPASRRFIARVADLRKLENDELDPSFELEISDGWYGVWSTVDSAMMKLIKKGTVKIGTKLIIQGAELLNCGDGCDPLELKESVRLKLSTNSVRRVKWNARMGFTRCPGPLLVSLASILPDGGTVGLTSAIVARVYPILYMSKDENGKSVVRNVQAENQIAADFEKERNLKSEKLYEEILSEVENKFKKGPKSKIDTKNLKWIMNPPALYRIISQEPEMHAFMSPEQLDIVKKYHEEITSKIQAEVQTALQEKLKDLAPQRQVTTLLKIRIIDPLTETSAMVTIWRPPEELCSLLTENRCIDFHALNASGIRNNVLQLTSGKTTCYKESKRFQMPAKFHRKLFDFSQLAGQCSMPLFGELDVVGVVVHVKEPEKPESVANVYLSDLKDNFLMITFWTSLKVFGFKELLKEGSIVTGTNLHWRQGLGSYVVPSVFANELTCFSSHSSQDYISKELSEFKAYFAVEDMKKFIGARKSALFSLLKDRGSNSTPVRRIDSIGVSPHIAKRLEKLKSYGPAPPLPKTPLLSSPDIRKGFRPPKINKTSLDSPKV